MNQYIITKKTHEKTFKTISWVVKAQDKDKIKKYPEYRRVYVEKDLRIICTDGYRLHLAYLNDYRTHLTYLEDQIEIKPGYYDLVSANSQQIILKEAEIIHPNYYACFPVLKTNNYIKIEDEVSFDAFLAKLIKNLPENMGINHIWVKDVINDDIINWTAYIIENIYTESGGYLPVRFVNKSDNREALIMPLDIKKVKTKYKNKI